LKPLFGMTADLIRQGQAQGSVRNFDPALLYYAMIALAGTPFSIRAEFEAVTGRDPASASVTREIAGMIRFLVFSDREQPGASRRRATHRAKKAHPSP
jgi:hypothetical protein